MELSGHEWQRAEEVLGCSAKGAQGWGQGKGGARTLLCHLTAPQLEPAALEVCWGHFSLGVGRAALKVHGGGKGGVLPLGPASANNLISSLSLSLSLSNALFFCLFFSFLSSFSSFIFSPRLVFQSAVRVTTIFSLQGRSQTKPSCPLHLGPGIWGSRDLWPEGKSRPRNLAGLSCVYRGEGICPYSSFLLTLQSGWLVPLSSPSLPLVP